MTGRSERFTALERITLMATIPAEGDYLDMKIVRKFRESLSFTEEEQKMLGFVRDAQGGTSWEGEDPNKAVYFGKRMEAIIVESLADLQTTKKLNDGHLSLYEKFIGGIDDFDYDE